MLILQYHSHEYRPFADVRVVGYFDGFIAPFALCILNDVVRAIAKNEIVPEDAIVRPRERLTTTLTNT